ncbi:MAG: CHASE3 domain-containing protein, partial [Verrucomicrobia bacterium]|nr:CHASE3 domain-containing protein [Verrucomicrobiota bacterium]
MINAKMQQWMTHWLVRYAAALAAVGAGWMLRAGLTSVVGPGLPTYVTFYPAVMLVALLAGFGPGIVATAAVALMTDYWLLPPIGFGIQGLAESVGLALFCGMGVFMSAVAALYHRARRQALAQDTEVWRTEKQISSGEPAGQALLLNAGLIVSLTILLAAGWQCLQYLGAATEADRQTTATYTLLEQVEQLLGALTDAETDERGFLLTGDEKYLGSYQAALGTVDASLAAMHRLAAGDPGQQQRLAVIEPLIRDRVAELKEAIALRRTRGLEAAVQFVKTGKGKSLMDEVRQRLGEAQEREEDFLQLVTTTRAADNRKTLQALLTGGIFGILVLVTVFLFLKRENAGRRRAEAELRLHRDRLQEAVTARTAELSQANASIQQQREWLHVTLSSIGDAVLVTDTAGRITFLNPVAERLLGCLEEEALGQPVQEVFRTVDEETRVPAEDIFARVLREGCAISLANHTALVTRDGKEIPIEDSAAPIRHSTGTVSGVVVVFHDVTEKRRAQAAVLESERQFRTLADSIPNLAWWANVDGYITWYNRRWYEYTGTTPQQMEGWGWQSVHDPVLLPAVLEKWRTSLATGQAFEMTFPLRG